MSEDINKKSKAYDKMSEDADTIMYERFDGSSITVYSKRTHSIFYREIHDKNYEYKAQAKKSKG